MIFRWDWLVYLYQVLLFYSFLCINITLYLIKGGCFNENNLLVRKKTWCVWNLREFSKVSSGKPVQGVHSGWKSWKQGLFFRYWLEKLEIHHLLLLPLLEKVEFYFFPLLSIFIGQMNTTYSIYKMNWLHATHITIDTYNAYQYRI